MNTIYVFLGGGLGAAARWTISRVITSDGLFPYATLLVNLVGCFLIGLIYHYTVKNSMTLYLLAVTGFLGGFTTFSSYGMELLKMLQAQDHKNLLFYFLTSNFLGVLLVYIGYKTGTYLIP